MSRWFRHYAGMMRDDKLVRVAIQSKQSVERVLWVFGAILESAAEINDGGRFDFDTAEAAYFLRATEDDIRAVVDGLIAVNRVADNCVVKWGARQFESDRSATRQAAYRERKRSEKCGDNDTQTSGDGDVTSPSRHGDAPETETETETEAKTEKNKKEPSLRSVARAESTRATSNDDWPKDYREKFWERYPRKQSRKSAFKALDRIRKSGETTFARLMAGIEKIPIGEPTFVPHAATWLNGARWEDEPPPPPKPTTGPSFQDIASTLGARANAANESGYSSDPRPGTKPNLLELIQPAREPGYRRAGG